MAETSYAHWVYAPGSPHQSNGAIRNGIMEQYEDELPMPPIPSVCSPHANLYQDDSSCYAAPIFITRNSGKAPNLYPSSNSSFLDKSIPSTSDRPSSQLLLPQKAKRKKSVSFLAKFF